MLLTDINQKSKRKITLDSAIREFIRVNPFESHVLRNLDDTKDCEILIIISEEYDENNPDTFKFEG